MGFFDKMFEKKECAICGTELGLLGKTKINEGAPILCSMRTRAC